MLGNNSFIQQLQMWKLFPMVYIVSRFYKYERILLYHNRKVIYIFEIYFIIDLCSHHLAIAK